MAIWQGAKTADAAISGMERSSTPLSRKIADGRIYTAKQALDNGLIDEIGTLEDAVLDMQSEYGLQDCAVEDFIPESKTDFSDLLGIVSEQNPISGLSDAALIEELVALNGTFRVSYIASVKK